jgi:hypothetical protein
VSNQPYSTTLNGANSIKTLFVTEGENLVSLFKLMKLFINNRLVVQNYAKNYGRKCVGLILEKKEY